jgi:hypothetical protein
MSETKWEYKVAYVDRWQRTSVEGKEAHPEEGERASGFGRRFLNGFGSEGWELVGIQHTVPGQSYFIFKRPVAAGAEPDVSVVRREQRSSEDQPAPPEQPTGDEVVSL